MKKIQMVDLKSQYERLKDEIDDAIRSVIESSVFIKGEHVDSFQDNLSDKLGVKHTICVANGTDALKIALMSCGIGSGDEIITPTFTFVATAEVGAALGCNVVLVDVDKDTFCMDMNALKQAITDKTKAIIPVHLFGQNSNLEQIMAIAKEKNITVIEDACQSINADYVFSDGTKKKSGTIGKIGCTSFFPSKNLGCFGDGGAIFTDDDEIMIKSKSLANHGMSKEKYIYDRVGLNSRLDSIQAAILNVKLRHLDDFTARRQKSAAIYDQLLGNNKDVVIPFRSNYSEHVFHQYTIKLPIGVRDKVRECLMKKEIPSMIYYPKPLHTQTPYFDKDTDKFKNSDLLSQTVLSLPMHTELDEEQQEFICKTIVENI